MTVFGAIRILVRLSVFLPLFALTVYGGAICGELGWWLLRTEQRLFRWSETVERRAGLDEARAAVGRTTR